MMVPNRTGLNTLSVSSFILIPPPSSEYLSCSRPTIKARFLLIFHPTGLDTTLCSSIMKLNTAIQLVATTFTAFSACLSNVSAFVPAVDRNTKMPILRSNLQLQSTTTEQQTLPELKLYNSLTRTKDPMIPLTPPKNSMYTCGPTVYDRTQTHPTVFGIYRRSHLQFDRCG